MHIHPDLFVFGVILFIILWISIRIVVSRRRKTPVDSRWTATIRHLGLIAVAIGVLLMMVEATTAMTALEQSTREIPVSEIVGGLKSTMYSAMHGLIVYIISLILFSLLRSTGPKEANSGKE